MPNPQRVVPTIKLILEGTSRPSKQLESSTAGEADNLPAMIAVAVGAIADPNFPAPIKSVFEQSKHVWVEISGPGVEHLQQGSTRKNAR